MKNPPPIFSWDTKATFVVAYSDSDKQLTIETYSSAMAAYIAQAEHPNFLSKSLIVTRLNYDLGHSSTFYANSNYDQEKAHRHELEVKLKEIEEALGKSSASSDESNYRSGPAHRVDAEALFIEALGLVPGFTLGQLKKAYKAAMMRNHPDKVAHMDGDFAALANKKSKFLNEALEFLKGKTMAA